MSRSNEQIVEQAARLIRDQAVAWREVFNLVYDMTEHRGEYVEYASGLDIILATIRNMKAKADMYDELMREDDA